MNSEKKYRSGLFTPGVSLLPEDFPDRLTVLKEITGLSWEGLSVCLGVDNRQMLRWRRGVAPCGGAMLSLVNLATEVPEGLGRLLDRDLVVLHRGRHGDASRVSRPYRVRR